MVEAFEQALAESLGRSGANVRGTTGNRLFRAPGEKVWQPVNAELVTRVVQHDGGL